MNFPHKVDLPANTGRYREISYSKHMGVAKVRLVLGVGLLRGDFSDGFFYRPEH